MGRLDQKVAIVTGAGRPGNIGLAVCEAFLREGASVLATDLRDEHRAEIEEKFAGYGDRFCFKAQDICSPAEWQNTTELVMERFGQLDVLVNNAGIGAHSNVMTTSLDELRKVMAVNHDSILLGIQACAPLLKTARTRFRGGSIINTLSMASYMPRGEDLAYQVSKAAARMLTMCAAIELGPQQIRVNSVHPGVTLTPLLREGFSGYVERGMFASEEDAMDQISGASLLKISGTPDETAFAYIYLASDESALVTGASLAHGGGIGQHY